MVFEPVISFRMKSLQFPKELYLIAF